MSALLAAAGSPGALPVPQTKPGGARPLPKREPGDDPAVLSLAAALLPPLPSPPPPTTPVGAVASVGDGTGGTGGSANLPVQETSADLGQAGSIAPQFLAPENPVPESAAPGKATPADVPQAAPAPDPVAGRTPELAFGIRLSASAPPAVPQPASAAAPPSAQASGSAMPGPDSAADDTRAPGATPVGAGRRVAAVETTRPALGQGTSNQPREPDSRHPLPTASPESGSAVAVSVAAPAASLQPATEARGNAPQAAAPTAAPSPPPSSEPPREPAVRELSLAVSGPSVNGRPAGQVSLRVVERGGEVQVAVRTTDPQLAGDLRQNLPDLVSELSGRGYRAETWQPLASSGADSSTLPRATSTAADSSAGQSYSDQTGGGSRNGGSPAGQQQQQQRHGQDPNQPSWLQALTRGAAQTGSTPL